MILRDLGEPDREIWFAMRQRLWPTYPAEQLASEIDEFLASRSEWGLFLAEVEGEPAGFAECRLRESAAGCSTSGVGYLEAWYVEPRFRRQGVGAALVSRCEGWAKERGATEMASDTTNEYPNSPAAHGALGFVEVKRRFLYRKSLDE